MINSSPAVRSFVKARVTARVKRNALVARFQPRKSDAIRPRASSELTSFSRAHTSFHSRARSTNVTRARDVANSLEARDCAGEKRSSLGSAPKASKA